MLNPRSAASVARVAAAVVLASWTAGVTAGQAPAEDTKTWTAPRTPWGDPDLQGVWSNWDKTPFQAPDPHPDTESAKAIAAARAERYGPEGKADGIAGGMASVNFGPVSPRRPGAVVVDPPNGRVPINPKKIEIKSVRQMGDSWEYHDPWERCITGGMPGRLLGGGTGGYNKAYELFQSPGYVVIFTEIMHEARVIPVDGRPHVGSSIRQWSGDSRGHWDGPTLVVETTNFNDKGLAPGGSDTVLIPKSEALTVVERFTRTDAKTLTYEVTVTDPNVFTQPWTARQPHNFDPAYVLYEYACHEGNTRYMEGSLRKGRVRDAEEAAQRAKKAATETAKRKKDSTR
jgi:hypothetical protein